MGDLHMSPEQMHLFHEARDQMLQRFLTDSEGKPLPGARICQLGDTGHSKHASGSRASAQFARDFLDSFSGIPRAVVLGNHDMEGDEFPTDPDNLEAWQEVWQQPHHWAAELGHAVAIGLSTTRYRSNKFSHHEVHIDEEQMAWFEEQLKANQHRPVIVFTHAPPQGCGLKVLQEVHVKNRCAWLNHSDRPERFIKLVERFPNIKLWFSGHFHLSHNYEDSISTVGGTAFVQTGVIGECNRDGHRQSRLLSGDAQGFRLHTIDHSSGQVRLDMAHAWDSQDAPQPILHKDKLIPSPSAGWLTSQLDCSTDSQKGGPVKPALRTEWFPVGFPSMLALQGSTLVEYDMRTFAPIGLLGKVPPGCRVSLLDASGAEIHPPYSNAAEVQTVAVVDDMTGGSTRYPRNDQGGFFVIYQPNKWKLKQQKLMEEREARKTGRKLAAAH
ncbi:Metallo-dependent phosphatase-like protein [Dunaliella salina]|uniref:Metallo-dependent phosphatase-like protein n=1 Tax=Dunaliella salina TaxID=3046 RepID=A0ABQ7GRH0_DUNSA|nr:Metallo-dependent phosphatase-like protein [Dunaliella salina]|eukprot:KAF5837188.1 Metallo-dependent phosphatase-like protein [Dunaliella salina]